jgi:hypothetical protein
MTATEMPGLLSAKRPAEAIASPAPKQTATPVHAATAPTKRRDGSAIVLLVAMGLALAVTGGAALSGYATGALQAWGNGTGLGQDDAVEIEQRRQARAIAALDHRLAQISEQLAGLARDTAATAARDDSRRQDEIAGLRADMTTLRGELAAQRQAIVQPSPDGPADPHGAALAQAGIGLAALRSTLDERDRARGEQIAAVAQRVDRLEQMVMAHEATGSLRPAQATPAQPPRKRAQRTARAQWTVQQDFLGTVVVNEQGQRFAATRGARVPGLGRITDVRRQGDRLIVVTRRGVLTER